MDIPIIVTLEKTEQCVFVCLLDENNEPETRVPISNVTTDHIRTARIKHIKIDPREDDLYITDDGNKSIYKVCLRTYNSSQFG